MIFPRWRTTILDWFAIETTPNAWTSASGEAWARAYYQMPFSACGLKDSYMPSRQFPWFPGWYPRSDSKRLWSSFSLLLGKAVLVDRPAEGVPATSHTSPNLFRCNISEPSSRGQYCNYCLTDTAEAPHSYHAVRILLACHLQWDPHWHILKEQYLFLNN